MTITIEPEQLDELRRAGIPQTTIARLERGEWIEVNGHDVIVRYDDDPS